MSEATVTDITPALRESTHAQVLKLRAIAKSEFKMYEELRAEATRLCELADIHYGKHVAAATKADDISARLRRLG